MSLRVGQKRSFGEVFWKWIFFGIVITSLPIFVDVAIAKAAGVDANFLEILKDGKLLIVSICIYSSSISTFMGGDNSDMVGAFAKGVTVLLLIVTCITYGLFVVSTQVGAAGNMQLDIEFKGLMSIVLYSCAILSGLYVVMSCD
jgi:hypothetical protein